MRMYPLILDPAYKHYIWGGDRIPRRYGRPVPAGIYAESWEVSDRFEGPCAIRNGPLAGRSLRDVLESDGPRILGTGLPPGRFPLLVKLIDARERLSVQVHPDDESAARLGAEAKTEAWHVLDAAPGAHVLAGFRPGATERDFRAALESGRLEDLLVSIPARRGETIFIPGGCVHAICEGCLLLEAQQNSNTTYRVWDWGRPAGAERPLHVKEALACIRWSAAARVVPAPAAARPGALEPILACPHFELAAVTAGRVPFDLAGGGRFQILFAAEGAARVRAGNTEAALPHGATCLVPAAEPVCSVTAAGAATLLRIRAP